MAEQPSVSRTTIDNLITRKHMREKALYKIRSRDRIQPFNKRTQLLNSALEANAKAPILKKSIKQSFNPENSPEHVALIPDGNRRYAKARDQNVGFGYYVGAKKIEDIVKLALLENQTDFMTIFLLSTENIERRPENELDQLFTVFENFFNKIAEEDLVHNNNIKYEVRGNESSMDKLPDSVLNAINNMEEATSQYSNKQVTFLLPYGGRDEIIQAASKVESPLVDDNQISVSKEGEDANQFRQNLMLGDLPDTDLMIRTSEKRLSNFMLYHVAYSELSFFQKNWPAFSETDFYEAMYKYENRDRRFGV